MAAAASAADFRKVRDDRGAKAKAPCPAVMVRNTEWILGNGRFAGGVVEIRMLFSEIFSSPGGVEPTFLDALFKRQGTSQKFLRQRKQLSEFTP